MNKNNPRIFYKEGWGQEGLPLSCYPDRCLDVYQRHEISQREKGLKKDVSIYFSSFSMKSK